MINKVYSIIVIFFLLLLTTCTHVVTNRYADYNCLIKPDRTVLTKDKKARKFRAIIETTDRLSEYDFGRILVASQLASNVIKTERFRKAVLNYEHNGYKGFTWTELTREEVYDVIIKGAEKHTPSDDYTMSFIATSFDSTKEDDRVIAFVYGSRDLVYFNKKYLFHNSIRIANTLTHEWLHMLGFEHDRDDTPARKYSVPYAVGDIVQEIAMGYYKPECWWK
jgi:hypothetical protein